MKSTIGERESSIVRIEILRWGTQMGSHCQVRACLQLEMNKGRKIDYSQKPSSDCHKVYKEISTIIALDFI